MSDHDTIKNSTYDDSRNTQRSRIVISSEDARQGETGHAMLRVLGLAMAGTILVNLMIVIYFSWFGTPLC